MPAPCFVSAPAPEITWEVLQKLAKWADSSRWRWQTEARSLFLRRLGRLGAGADMPLSGHASGRTQRLAQGHRSSRVPLGGSPLHDIVRGRTRWGRAAFAAIQSCPVRAAGGVEKQLRLGALGVNAGQVGCGHPFAEIAKVMGLIFLAFSRMSKESTGAGAETLAAILTPE